MTDTAKPAKVAGTTPAPERPHDEVVSLSIRKDGSLDQHDPKIIGDPAAAIETTKKQFAQMAVAAKDGLEHREELDAEAEAKAGPDPLIEKRKQEHETLVAAAEAKAERVVKALS